MSKREEKSENRTPTIQKPHTITRQAGRERKGKNQRRVKFIR